MKFIGTILTLCLLLGWTQTSLAQSRITVKGVVTDKSTGEPAIGISIRAGSPPKAVGVTDENGAFSVTVDKGTFLSFKGIGFDEFRKRVNSSTDNMEVVLGTSSKALNEFVVQGFQQKTKMTTTGSVTKISGEEIQDVPVANVADLLQGKVAGLNIQINNGAPGVMGQVQLRGLSSSGVSSDGFLTPTAPLFVVDGVPVDPNQGYEYGFDQAGPGISPLSMIPPEDIAEIEVLKDAAATSIYGSKGAYGVILITTKRGKSRVPIVQYTGNVFFNTPPKLREVIGGKDERRSRVNQILGFDSTYRAGLALINTTPFLSDSLNPYYNNHTNWQDVFFRTTYNMTHNLSISGGDERFNYKANLNYYQENGIIQNTGFKRYGINMNALYQPTNRFRMMATINTTYGKKQNGSGVGLLQQGVASGVNSSSLLPPPSLFSENNAALQTASVDDDNKDANIRTNLDIQWEPVKGFRLGDNASYDYTSSTSNRFSPSFLNDGFSHAYNYSSRNVTLYNRATLTYTKTINGLHNVNAFVFDELQKNTRRANVISLVQTPNDNIRGPIGSDWFASGGGTLDNLQDVRIHGYGGSFSYNYNLKYVVDFSFRFDGTSTNGPSSGYSKNPAISARWNFYKEPWFDNVTWLSYASLRGSWGRNIVPTGNVFDVFGRYSPGGSYDGQSTIQMDFDQIPNTDFMPQTTTTTDFGLEAGLFDDRLELDFDAYYKSVDNQITSVELPKLAGFNSIMTNAVSLVDYGFEWMATFRIFKPNIDEKALQSTISINGAINKDVLTRLPGNLRQMRITQDDGISILYRLGKNTLSNLLYYTNSVYPNNEAVPTDPATGLPQQIVSDNNQLFVQGGDPKFGDINGDYLIDDQDNDFVVVGDPMPKIVGGISSYTTFQNFTLRINVSYTLKRDLLNTNIAGLFRYYGNPTELGPLLPIDQFDYWQPEPGKKFSGNRALYPNPFDFTRYNVVDPFKDNQTLFLEDGSYWKINTVTLSYNIPREKTRQVGITSTRVYFTVNNLYTFSKYTGPDPENVSALGRDISGGYPQRRNYTLGLSVQF